MKLIHIDWKNYLIALQPFITPIHNDVPTDSVLQSKTMCKWNLNKTAWIEQKIQTNRNDVVL